MLNFDSRFSESSAHAAHFNSAVYITICSPRPIRAVQRARLCAMTWIASQAPLAAKRPDGMWFSPTPYLRSRMAFSTSAWRRWSASSFSISSSRSWRCSIRRHAVIIVPNVARRTGRKTQREPGKFDLLIVIDNVILSRALPRIHRWTGMDGERTLEGGEEVTDADGPSSNSGRWGIGDGLQALLGTPMAAYSGCGERDGGIGHGKMRSRTGLARVGGDVGGTGGRAPSGWEWNGSQPGQGATELGFPRPALWQMQGEAACRAGEPSGQGEDPSSEGLGGHDLLTQTDAGCPASHLWAVQRARLCAIT